MGRKAEPVRVITSADLVDNGGQYKLISKDAIKVSGNDTLEIMGGSPVVVYPVPVSEIGDYNLIQGEPIHVTEAPASRGQDSSRWAYPVYHVGPGTWPPAQIPAGCGLDSEYCAYETAMAVAPSDTWRNAASQLFVDLRTALGVASLANALDFAYILAAETEQAALLNMVKREHDATNVNAVAFEASRGLTGNGTTSYLNTNYNPGTQGINYLLNDVCVGIYSRTDIAVSRSDMGCATNTSNATRLQLRLLGSETFRGGVNGAIGALEVAVASSLSLFTMTRIEEDHSQAYQAGVSIGEEFTNATSVPSFNLFICGHNNAGALQSPTTRQYAFAFAGRGMNATEQANFYLAVQDFMTAIGADV